VAQYLIRTFKRFAILLPGVVIAYFSVANIFPYFDQRLPLSLAILITYALAAYVLIPGFIRLYRIVRPATHLPLYCVTPDGFASDPLNIGIIANRRELILAMEKAGWYMADPHTPRNVIKAILSTALGWDYPSAPVSSLYLFGRKQDLAFEIPITGSTGHRHHVRFWATTYEGRKPLTIQTIHWHHRRAHVQHDDDLLWVGAASLDVGVRFIRHNLQLTHMIDPDTNKERQLIIDQLRSQKLLKRLDKVKLGEPYRLINRVINGSLHTDGVMIIGTLKTLGAKARHSRSHSRNKS
jgi:hypothetical protein